MWTSADHGFTVATTCAILQPMKFAAIDVSGNDPALPFYVYMYRDTRIGKGLVPIYVGKGRDTFKKRNASRARRHWLHGSQNPTLRAILGKMRSVGVVPRLEVIARFATEEESFAHEVEMIAKYGRRNTGSGTLCNLTDGGEGPSGAVPSDEARQRMSAAQRRVKNYPEAKERVSAAMKLVHADSEFAAKRAASLRAVMATPEHKAKRSAIMKEVHARPGSKESRYAKMRLTLAAPEARALKASASKAWQASPNVEAKRKHSAGLKRRWASEEEKAKQSERMRVMHSNPDHKARHRDAVRQAQSSPELRAKRSAVAKEKYADPAEREKLSAAMKEWWRVRKQQKMGSVDA